MREIIYIANVRIPTEKAHGKQIMKTCDALKRSKISLELWLPKRRQINAFRGVDPFDYYGVKTRFNILYLPTFDLLKYSGGWPKSFQIMAYFLQEISFLISLIFSSPTAQVVYTRSLTAAVVMKLIHHRKAYFEIHNITEHTVSRKIQAIIWRYLDGVTAISNGLARELHASSVTKIAVIPDAVEPAEFSTFSQLTARQKLKISNKKRIILYSGSLAPRKGVYDLALATKYFPKINLETWFVGGTLTRDDVEEFKNFIRHEHLNSVKVTGYIPTEKMPLYLAAADILVLPSSAKVIESSKFTSPMKLFEYLAAGKPIVASDTAANREVLTDHVNAILTLPDDPKALAKGVGLTLSDKKLAAGLGRQARKDAKRYSWDTRAQKIIQFAK